MTELKTSKDILQQITTDLFLIKEKLKDKEYKQLLDRCSTLFKRLEKDDKTKLQLYKQYDRVRDEYMKQGRAFVELYTEYHLSPYEDSLITFQSIN
jgi:hypothetical protein